MCIYYILYISIGLHSEPIYIYVHFFDDKPESTHVKNTFENAVPENQESRSLYHQHNYWHFWYRVSARFSCESIPPMFLKSQETFCCIVFITRSFTSIGKFRFSNVLYLFVFLIHLKEDFVLRLAENNTIWSIWFMVFCVCFPAISIMECWSGCFITSYVWMI